MAKIILNDDLRVCHFCLLVITVTLFNQIVWKLQKVSVAQLSRSIDISSE